MLTARVRPRKREICLSVSERSMPDILISGTVVGVLSADRQKVDTGGEFYPGEIGVTS